MAQSKNHPLRPLLIEAVRRDTPLDPKLARLAHALAVRGADTELCSALAARTDLPDDIDAAISVDMAVPVRIAYLSRPGVSVEERTVALATETRGTVLAMLAADPKCDPNLLDVLAEHKTLGTVFAVLTNEGAPQATRRKAALRIDAGGWKLDGAKSRVFADFLRDDHKAHDLYAKTFNAAVNLGHLTTATEMSAEGAHRVLTKLVSDKVIDSAARDKTWRGVAKTSNVTAIMCGLTRGPELADTSVKHMIRGATWLLEEGDDRSVTFNLKWLLGRLRARQDGPLGDHLRTAHSSVDPIELAGLAKYTDDCDVARLIALNLHASVETTLVAMRNIKERGFGSVMLARRRHQHDVMLGLWQGGLYWDNFSPRDDEVDLALSMLSVGAPMLNKQRLAVNLAQRGLLPDGAAGSLPLDCFSHSYLPETLSTLAAEVLTSALDVTDVTPGLLLTMAEDYSGSLDELIGMCELLDAPNPASAQPPIDEASNDGDALAGDTPAGDTFTGVLDFSETPHSVHVT